MSDLNDLVSISRYAGREVLLVQGGGGNTSVKSADGARMWIKASGLRLAQVRPGFGYLETSVAALRALLDDAALAALPRGQAHAAAVTRTQAATLGESSLRPSLETTFHAVLGRVVLHTHPVYLNAFTCMAQGAEALAEAVGERVPWLPYVAPGYALGRAVAGLARDHAAQDGRLPDTLVLGNHGLIASAERAPDTVASTERLFSAGQSCFGALPAGACDPAAPPPALVSWAEGLREALAGRYGLSPHAFSVRPAARRALLDAAREPEAWLQGGALVPDDVVYGGHHVLAADPARSPSAWVAGAPEAWPQTGKLIVAVRGLGVVFAGPSVAFLDAMEENLLAHVLIRVLIARRGTPRTLPEAEVQYLLSMEAEHYRQRVAAAGARSVG